ncbi:expressed unknown protein [Seminavis robusta]|uniref:Uncharacterized protein n=1 Tax=Seminavis robusta TaxID=568900 RepID=A0A9N8HWE1_9STRA|nr:expressed unknown protein [Seminavis robusta]|eukprot:Sro2192_g318440.1 n/a (221) ;mRNA; f:12230-12892
MFGSTKLPSDDVDKICGTWDKERMIGADKNESSSSTVSLSSLGEWSGEFFPEDEDGHQHSDSSLSVKSISSLTSVKSIGASSMTASTRLQSRANFARQKLANSQDVKRKMKVYRQDTIDARVMANDTIDTDAEVVDESLRALEGVLQTIGGTSCNSKVLKNQVRAFRRENAKTQVMTADVVQKDTQKVGECLNAMERLMVEMQYKPPRNLKQKNRKNAEI